jgi:hypothetical protein
MKINLIGKLSAGLAISGLTFIMGCDKPGANDSKLDSRPTIFVPGGCSLGSIAIGDVDGDGKNDLAVLTKDDSINGYCSVYVLINKGDGFYNVHRPIKLEEE